jgi:CO/xanthine dehydrogenase FAD-binding subunit
LQETRFLNLWGLDALRGLRCAVRADDRRAGDHADLIRSKHVQKRLPMLVAAAREVGGVQIQNRGTIGGNVANASPAGDTLPVLAVADAVVVLQSVDGPRRVPFNDFYTGYRQTVRRADELIVAFEIAPVPGRQWFRKVGTRAAQAISKIVMAGVAPRAAGRRSRPAWRWAAWRRRSSVRATEAALARGESIGRAAHAGRRCRRSTTSDPRRIPPTGRREPAAQFLRIED